VGSGEAERFLDVPDVMVTAGVSGGTGEVDGEEGEVSASESGIVRGGGMA
jgi:hypothetical protein